MCVCVCVSKEQDADLTSDERTTSTPPRREDSAERLGEHAGARTLAFASSLFLRIPACSSEIPSFPRIRVAAADCRRDEEAKRERERELVKSMTNMATQSPRTTSTSTPPPLGGNIRWRDDIQLRTRTSFAALFLFSRIFASSSVCPSFPRDWVASADFFKNCRRERVREREKVCVCVCVC